jgi:hypothetical protein
LNFGNLHAAAIEQIAAVFLFPRGSGARREVQGLIRLIFPREGTKFLA